jgi:putative membrane protein
VVIALVVRWIGGAGHSSPPGAAGPSGREALDILRERFARGEIDAAEFEERKRLLAE